MNWVLYIPFIFKGSPSECWLRTCQPGGPVRIKQNTPLSYYVRACAQANPPVLQMIQILLVAVLTSALVSNSKVSF